MEQELSNKMVFFDPTPKPKKNSKNNNNNKVVNTEKPKIKRVITETDKWPTNLNSLDNAVPTENNDTTLSPDFHTQYIPLFTQQIRQKISGYRSQDVEKDILDIQMFVTYQDVLDLFKISDMICYYCKDKVLILYEYVREPKQWTLERLDNKKGHNRDNVVLACLRCNLRRRCMAYERYVQTKQMAKIIKIV